MMGSQQQQQQQKARNSAAIAPAAFTLQQRSSSSGNYTGKVQYLFSRSLDLDKVHDGVLSLFISDGRRMSFSSNTLLRQQLCYAQDYLLDVALPLIRIVLIKIVVL